MITYFDFFKVVTALLKSRSLVFIITILTLSLSTVFSGFIFIKSFEHRYFDTMKSIFPNHYIHAGKKLASLPKEIIISQEIFEPNLQSFIIYLNKTSSPISINNAALRSFNTNFIPKVINTNEDYNSIIYITKPLNTRLKNNKLYHDILYLKGLDDKLISLKVVVLDLGLKSNWFLMSNDTIKKIYEPIYLDKIVFYSNKIDENTLVEVLSSTIEQKLHHWTEHIALKSRALNKIMLLIFSIVFFTITLVSVFSIAQLAESLFDDISVLTNFAILFGISKFKLLVIYSSIMILTLLLIVSLSFYLSIEMNTILISWLWDTKATIPDFTLSFGLTLAIILFSISYYVYFKDHISRRGRACNA